VRTQNETCHGIVSSSTTTTDSDMLKVRVVVSDLLVTFISSVCGCVSVVD
jgi:hypothetical protein